jgi:hypothetical protein
MVSQPRNSYRLDAEGNVATEWNRGMYNQARTAAREGKKVVNISSQKRNVLANKSPLVIHFMFALPAIGTKVKGSYM